MLDLCSIIKGVLIVPEGEKNISLVHKECILDSDLVISDMNVKLPFIVDEEQKMREYMCLRCQNGVGHWDIRG